MPDDEHTDDAEGREEEARQGQAEEKPDAESTLESEVPSAAWTGASAPRGAPLPPPGPTAPTAEAGTSATTAVTDPADSSRPGWFRRSWTLRRWLVIAIPIAVLVIGIVIGGATQSGRVNDLESEKAALQKKVTDRETQSRSDEARAKKDEARAKKIEQERQRAAGQEQRRQAAEEQRRQQEEQQRQQQEQQRQQQEQQRQQEEQQREAARQNTLSGDGLFAVGTDIRPGRFQTAGPSGGNSAGCYYAVLNSPDTFDIVSNNITKGPAIVDLAAGKYFETTACQEWHRIG
jgi:hypothetical protein